MCTNDNVYFHFQSSINRIWWCSTPTTKIMLFCTAARTLGRTEDEVKKFNFYVATKLNANLTLWNLIWHIIFTVSSWQLSKQLSGLNTEHTNAINAAIEANADLDLAQYDKTSQSNEACFYYPVWDTLPPTIELPGPCDSSITGFANFDAAAVSSH